jgi:hypothetical protein
MDTGCNRGKESALSLARLIAETTNKEREFVDFLIPALGDGVRQKKD